MASAFKITYLDETPIKKSKYPIQSVLDKFMNTDKPAMQIDFEGHYANDAVGATTWRSAIKRSGYAISLRKINGTYVAIKDTMVEEED